MAEEYKQLREHLAGAVESVFALPTPNEQASSERFSFAVVEQTLKAIGHAADTQRVSTPEGQQLVIEQKFQYEAGQGPLGIEEPIVATSRVFLNEQLLPERIQVVHHCIDRQSSNEELLPPTAEIRYVWRQYDEKVREGKVIKEPYMGIVGIFTGFIKPGGDYLGIAASTQERHIVYEEDPHDPSRTIATMKFDASGRVYTPARVQAQATIFSPELYSALGKTTDRVNAESIVTHIRELAEQFPFLRVIDRPDGGHEVIYYSTGAATLFGRRMLYDDEYRLRQDTIWYTSMTPSQSELTQYLQTGEPLTNAFMDYEGRRWVRTLVRTPYPQKIITQMLEETSPFLLRTLEIIPLPERISIYTQELIGTNPQVEWEKVKIHDSIPDEEKKPGVSFTRIIEGIPGKAGAQTSVEVQLVVELAEGRLQTRFVSGNLVQISEAPKE